ncbi:hypothetical protein [Streptomyces capoamus]|nr:hypothetical protein [Streptomyces capoamus]
MANHANASREEITAALRAGHPVNQIAADLHVDRARVRAIRNELGLPAHVRAIETVTIEDRWREYAKPLPGGHMDWTGERNATSNRPLLSHGYRHHSAAGIAFRIRTGRDPVGQVRADCGMQHCVAPDHVEDAPGRRRNREQLRYISGGRALQERCRNDHDQAEHGRVAADGRAYCNACKRARDARSQARRDAA